MNGAGHGPEASLWKRALQVLPGGVSSPVRAFRAVGGEPFFARRGQGARIWDVEGREYLDCVGSWGALILGHAPATVVGRAAEALLRGSSFGCPVEGEVRLAEEVRARMAGVEMLRFVSSGTEATMSAVRVARAATGRERVVKFAGCYHGHADLFLVRAGSGMATLGLPDSVGVPAPLAALTHVAPWNDREALRGLLAAHGRQVAAIILEPVPANMGVVPPREGFLAAVRALADEVGALLIFDEVITGFRVHRGGAQALLGIRPDLTCLGKVLGGGFPVGAYGGRRDLMELVAPAGAVYQAGTLAGNPVAMAAGLATLEGLDEVAYVTLEARGAQLEGGLRAAAEEAGVPVTMNRVGSLLTLFFTPGPVERYADAQKVDREAYAQFFRRMLAAGVFLPPSPFEAWFLSTAHSREDVAAIVEAAREALRGLGAR